MFVLMLENKYMSLLIIHINNNHVSFYSKFVHFTCKHSVCRDVSIENSSSHK